jgi:PAS domain S-box-containing protein
VAKQNLAGVCVVDHNGVVFANEALTQMFGIAADQLAGSGDPLDLVRHMAGDAPTASYEHRLRRSDGTTVPLQVSAHRIEHDGRPAVLAFVVSRSELSTLERVA